MKVTASSEQTAESSKRPEHRRMPTVVIVFICLLPAVVLPAVSGEAQQKKIRRIGYLASIPGGLALDALRRGLRDLGYIEGQDIVIESRSAEGKLD